MQAYRPILTRHRRQRFVLLALAMLHWIAAVLEGLHIDPRRLRQRGGLGVDRLARFVGLLIYTRAAELAAGRRIPLSLWRYGRDVRRRHMVRSLLGSRVRRTLRHKDMRARIAKLIDALRSLEAHAQRLARRLRRRLTRLCAIAPAPTAAVPLLGPPAPSPALADSS